MADDLPTFEGSAHANSQAHVLRSCHVAAHANHHTNFEIFFLYIADFRKLSEVSDFPIGLYYGWYAASNRNIINLWENHSPPRFFIKSALYKKNLKIGVVLNWTFGIVKNPFP